MFLKSLQISQESTCVRVFLIKLRVTRTATLLKETQKQVFFCGISVTNSCVYLTILRSFSEHLYHGAPLANCLFHVQVSDFQPPDTVKNYFICAFQAFCTRTISSHSKAFVCLNSWILSVKKLICNEVARCHPASLQKKVFRTSSFIYFAFIFSEFIMITSSREGLKVCEHNLFQEKISVKECYLQFTFQLRFI